MPSGKRIAGIYPHRKVPARGRLIGQDFLLCLQKKKKKNDETRDRFRSDAQTLPTKPKHKMQRRVFLYVILHQRAVIFELLASI